MRRLCEIDGCRNWQHGRGLCSAHLSRLKRNGTVAAGKPLAPRKVKSQTNYEWLQEHAKHSGKSCLIWPFGKFSNGYGQVCVKRVNKIASREMCALAHGEPPSQDHEAAHSCGNGHLGCVNPNHLRWATKLENEGDKALHRTVRGSGAVSIRQ